MELLVSGVRFYGLPTSGNREIELIVWRVSEYALTGSNLQMLETWNPVCTNNLFGHYKPKRLKEYRKQKSA